jgi:hypothetical protein
MQRGSAFNAYIMNLLEIYKKGIVRFLCLHPSFYAVIFTAIYFNKFSFSAFVLITFKTLDIIFKLILLDRIIKTKPLGMFTQMFENDMPLSFLFKLIVMAIYAAVFCAAFMI